MKMPGISPSGPPRLLRDSRVLALAYVGGGVAWALHFLLAYGVAEFGCIRGWDDVKFLGLNAIVWLILGATVVTSAGAAGATYLSVLIGREREGGGDVDHPGENSASFAARTAFATNLIFFCVILVETIPLFYFFHDC